MYVFVARFYVNASFFYVTACLSEAQSKELGEKRRNPVRNEENEGFQYQFLQYPTYDAW